MASPGFPFRAVADLDVPVLPPDDDPTDPDVELGADCGYAGAGPYTRAVLTRLNERIQWRDFQVFIAGLLGFDSAALKPNFLPASGL